MGRRGKGSRALAKYLALGLFGTLLPALAEDGPKLRLSIGLAEEREPGAPDNKPGWQRPAVIGYSRAGGIESSRLKAAFTYFDGENQFVPSPLPGYVWDFSLSIDRNTQTTKYADTRAIQANLQGAHSLSGTPRGLGFTSDLMAKYQRRKTDSASDAQGVWTLGLYYPDIGFKGGGTDPTTWWQPEFYFGPYYVDTLDAPAKTLEGKTLGHFARFKIAIFPLRCVIDNPSSWCSTSLGDRFSLRALAQYQHNTSAPTPGIEREFRYYESSAAVTFVAPDEKNTFIPGIQLKRTYGEDFLKGQPRRGATEILFTLAYFFGP